MALKSPNLDKRVQLRYTIRTKKLPSEKIQLPQYVENSKPHIPTLVLNQGPMSNNNDEGVLCVP